MIKKLVLFPLIAIGFAALSACGEPADGGGGEPPVAPADPAPMN